MVWKTGSGLLIIEAFRDHISGYGDDTANGLYNGCTQKGGIGNIPDTPGVIVWKKGHIGVYLGSGQVIESRGKDYGVVITKLKSRDFTNWGKLRDVDYTVASAGTTPVAPVPSGGIPELKDANGNDVILKYGSPHKELVKLLQERLNKHIAYEGNGGIGSVDGIFKGKTDKAVRRFQAARIEEGRDVGCAYNNNKPDGDVGPKTWALLWE